tara:strand:- start:2445 stop:3626 length:1182 start_codon:yes stop_codon:yes gene_type:complete
MNCKICNFKNKKKIIKIENFPLSNFFSKKINQKKIINLKFFTCDHCGLIQNHKSFNFKDLLGNQKNIKQKEPEEHLDSVVKKIINLKKLKKDSKIVSLTYKDDTILNRFKKKGFKKVNSFDFKDKFNNQKFEYLDNLIYKKNYKVSKKFQNSNLVISRHFLEHNYSLKNFFYLVNDLSKNSEESYILLEVPDTLKSLKNNDFACLWEQHKVYFTKNSLENCMNKFGYKKIFLDIKNYPYENCIVFFGKKERNIKKKINLNQILYEKKLSKIFFMDLFKFKKKIYKFFNSIKNKKIALYGTGHQGIFFVNFFNIKRFINFSFDDDKNLHNKFLPGTKIKILKPSKNFKKFDYIFISANQKAEKKISKKNGYLLNDKGKFLSLSFNNKNGIRNYV